ncbi:MAG: hypothetical protein MJ246_08550 [Clostridia bacterium]|nr:hypothetical protein [Clostridia bacterium]
MNKLNKRTSLSKTKDYIGRFYFFVSPSFVDSITGHAWIAILNESDEDIEIGNYIVRRGEYVSLGIFGPPKQFHIGLFYNRESRAQGKFPSRFKKNICVYHNFTRKNLEDLNEYIDCINTNSYRLFSNNCCHFATGAWNWLYGDEYSFDFMITPLRLFLQLAFSIKYDFLPGIRNVLFENAEVRHF